MDATSTMVDKDVKVTRLTVANEKRVRPTRVCPTRRNAFWSAPAMACIVLLLMTFLSPTMAATTTQKPETKTIESVLSESGGGIIVATETLMPSTGAGDIATASTAPLPTGIPEPFDTGLGNNFTSSSCPQFFRTFLGDATFKQCYPFSLLLEVRLKRCPCKSH